MLAPLLETTIEAYPRANRTSFTDPSRTLAAAGLGHPGVPQNVPNTTHMGQALLDLINRRNLRVNPTKDLRAQTLSMARTAALDGRPQPL